MKYYIEFPILPDCNLKCSYCFHRLHHRAVAPEKCDKPWFECHRTFQRKFNLKDYIKFRDTHLKDASEIILHFAGGEPFIRSNLNAIKSIMSTCDKEKFDILSNGLHNGDKYLWLENYKDRIDRIGLTFHRKIIKDSTFMKKRFIHNVLLLKHLGLNVYVKEILWPEFKEEIANDKKFLESKGVSVKIQDAKTGHLEEDSVKYDLTCLQMISPEYNKAKLKSCTCKKGYKSFCIIGFEENSGDVVACWHDQKIIGNIQKNEFNPSYSVCINPNGSKSVNGIGFYHEYKKEGCFDKVQVIGAPGAYVERLNYLIKNDHIFNTQGKKDFSKLPTKLLIYSNSYEQASIQGDYKEIEPVDRDMLLTISDLLPTYHLINWQRNYIFDIDKSKISDLWEVVNNIIDGTIDIFTFKCLVYLDKCIIKGMYFVDDYMIKTCPFLEYYIIRH